MDTLTTTATAFRVIAATGFQLLILALALVAIAFSVLMWLAWLTTARGRLAERARAKERITRDLGHRPIPSARNHRALEAANRTPVVIPKRR